MDKLKNKSQQSPSCKILYFINNLIQYIKCDNLIFNLHNKQNPNIHKNNALHILAAKHMVYQMFQKLFFCKCFYGYNVQSS
jgi:hypothetical protein